MTQPGSQPAPNDARDQTAGSTPNTHRRCDQPRSSVALGVMTKYWQPGLVKTRMAAELLLGSTTQDSSDLAYLAAARMHQAFTLHLGHELTAFDGPRFAVVSPDDRAPDVASAMGEGWTPLPQGEGDLGDRLRRVTEFLLQSAAAVILVGADLPTLRARDLDATVTHLRAHELVIGPALDGGYYLIALSGPWIPGLERLFDNMPWSTARLLDETIHRAESMGLRYALLPAREDIDDMASCSRLIDTLNQSGDLAQRRLALDLMGIRGSIQAAVHQHADSRSLASDLIGNWGAEF